MGLLQFQAAGKISTNKDALIEAVATFQEKYPDTGILLVVDELLDYLEQGKNLSRCLEET